MRALWTVLELGQGLLGAGAAGGVDAAVLGASPGAADAAAQGAAELSAGGAPADPRLAAHQSFPLDLQMRNHYSSPNQRHAGRVKNA